MDPLPPTDRELEALKILWDRGEATIREVFEAMTDDGEQIAYTTVLSLFQVMEQKGLVSHRREGKAYVYSAQIDREKTLRELAAGFLERVFDGSLDEYLVHALGARRVSKNELEQLESMLAEARRGKRSQRSPRKRGKSS